MPLPKKLTMAAGAVTAVLLLAGCVQSGSGAPPETGAPAGELNRFYDQELAFETCTDFPALPAEEENPLPADSYDCAYLEVPLDYSDPEAQSAQIAVVRVSARGDDPTGSILLNPGGPGSPGTNFALDMAKAWATSPITESFNLVGFDPRGVGATTPAIDCYSDDERDADAILASISSGTEDWTEEQTQQLVQQCAELSGGEEVLAHVGTRDVARDMDVLRAVLGDDGLTYAGGSYGTRLGAVYAEMFPQNVRALVFDGAVDPLARTHERRVQQYAGLQRSFEQFSAACAQLPECPLGTDPAQATTVFQQIVRPLIDAPVPVPAADGRELTYVQAIDAVVSGLYTPALWEVLIQGITELKSGEGETLLAMRDYDHQRSADGTYPNGLEALLAINCLDEERHTPEQETAMKTAVFEAAPFADPGQPVVEARDGCENWPAEPTLAYPYATDIPDLPETLTVSVTGDGLTPHDGAIRLAETLGSSLLTVEGEQHGTLPVGNACVDEIVADYLLTLTTPPEGATCTL